MSIKKDYFYSGTSGLVLPVPKLLYPKEFQDKSRLTYYSSLFNSVEINSSFYKMPMASTISKWASSVPDYFRFTFKLLKTITHNKGLFYNPDDIDLFLQTIENVGNKKGCLLIQFPPSNKVDNLKQLKKLLITLKHSYHENVWKLAIEFRDSSWYHEDVYDLLSRYKVSMVIHDLTASATPHNTYHGEFFYIRFHGPGGRYRGSYTDEFLLEYAKIITSNNDKINPAYFYFNNTMGDAVKNLTTLNKMIEHLKETGK